MKFTSFGFLLTLVAFVMFVYYTQFNQSVIDAIFWGVLLIGDTLFLLNDKGDE